MVPELADKDINAYRKLGVPIVVHPYIAIKKHVRVFMKKRRQRYMTSALVEQSHSTGRK